jgi:hypothetical protein
MPDRITAVCCTDFSPLLFVVDVMCNLQVRLNVTEGLTCGFRQQAVAIDTHESEFVALGDVQKTIVATPDLNGAFVPS